MACGWREKFFAEREDTVRREGSDSHVMFALGYGSGEVLGADGHFDGTDMSGEFSENDKASRIGRDTR
jgi:hypothetical protein